MEINAQTRLCILIGNPVKHSVSPQIHNSAFQALGLNYVYLAFRVIDLEGAVRGIKALGIRGASVTIPYKEKIIPLLDELDDLAQKIGAVNTIVNEGGKLIGYNTDGLAVYQSLCAYGFEPKDKKIILLGAGGASRAIAFVLAQKLGSGEMIIFNRTFERAKNLAQEIKAKLKANVRAMSLDDALLAQEIKTAKILINATSLGMTPEVEKTPIPKNLLHSDLCVFDIVYNPAKTRLLSEAEKIGAKIIAGIEMLVRQAGEQFRLWTGKPAPLELMFEKGKSALEKITKQDLTS